MRIARVQSTTLATPVLALVRDGAYYDVAELEAHYTDRPEPHSVDFHTRLFGLSATGLSELDQHLIAGRRPSETRLDSSTFLPLVPCDPDRAAFVQLGPYASHDTDQPAFALGDARGLVPDAQPVPFVPAVERPDFEACLAVVLGEELWRATPEQAERAVLGYTLALLWHDGDGDGWQGRAAPPVAPSQLGPLIVTTEELPDLAGREVMIRVDDDSWSAGCVGDWRYSPAECVAYVSQFHPLRAGDVVATGCFAGASAAAAGRRIAHGQRVTLSVQRLADLTGWAVRGPALGRWQRTL